MSYKDKKKQREYNRNYYQRKYHKKYQVKYYQEIKERINNWRKDKKKLDVKFYLNCVIGSNIHKALKKNKAGRHWETLVGYTLQDLMQHSEALFEPWMNWDNHGRGKGKWNIDRIKPKSLFNFKTAEDKEFQKCWALENLQPLEAIENIRKGNKY